MYALKDFLYIRKHAVSSCQQKTKYLQQGYIIIISTFMRKKNSNILLIHVLRCTWLLGIIRFDAANVRRLFRHEDLHQFHQAVFKLSGRL